MKRRCLHLLTGPQETWVSQVIEEQRKAGHAEIIEFDLAHPDVDYDDVLEQIFRSDSISVW